MFVSTLTLYHLLMISHSLIFGNSICGPIRSKSFGQMLKECFLFLKTLTKIPITAFFFFLWRRTIPTLFVRLGTFDSFFVGDSPFPAPDEAEKQSAAREPRGGRMPSYLSKLSIFTFTSDQGGWGRGSNTLLPHLSRMTVFCLAAATKRKGKVSPRSASFHTLQKRTRGA